MRKNMLSISDFQRSVEVVTQAISQKKIPVSFMGTEAFTQYKEGVPSRIVLPVVTETTSQEAKKNIQGYLDHEAAHVLYSDGTELETCHKRIVSKFGREVGQACLHVVNRFEDARIEKLLGQRYKGSVENLDELLESLTNQSLQEIKKLPADDPELIQRNCSELLDFLYPCYLRGSLKAKQLIFDNEKLFKEAIKEAEEGKKGFLNRALTKANSVAEMFAVLEKLLDDLRFDPSKMSDSMGDDNESKTQGEKTDSLEEMLLGDSQENSDTENKESKEKGEDEKGQNSEKDDKSSGKDAGRKEENSQEDSEEESEEAGKGEKGCKEEEITKALRELAQAKNISEMLKKEISDKLRNEVEEDIEKAYRPFTTDYDMIEPYDTKTVEEFANQYYESFDEFVNSAKRYAPVVQKQLERYMNAKSASLWEYGHRSGRLYGAGLSRLMTGDERIFRKRIVSTSKDVAVTLLIDMSGSMCGSRITNACKSAYVFGKALSAMGINFEILGFTTQFTPPELYSLKNKHLSSTPPDKFAYRIEPLLMPVIKSFGEKFTTQTVQSLFYTSYEYDQMRNNVDGEAVYIASRRLLAQPQKRKILFVFSDGMPAFDTVPSYTTVADKHLKRAIKDCTEAGIEIFGLGIECVCVKEFYEHCVVINDIEELGDKLLSELKKFLFK